MRFRVHIYNYKFLSIEIARLSFLEHRFVVSPLIAVRYLRRLDWHRACIHIREETIKKRAGVRERCGSREPREARGRMHLAPHGTKNSGVEETDNVRDNL